MLSEKLLIVSVALAGFAGVPGLFVSRDGRGAERLFVGLTTLAGVCASLGAVGALAFGWSGDLAVSWSVPGGSLAVRVDPISAMFVLQIAP